MRILVIGGTGFIGRFLVRDLAAHGHAVAVVHRGLTRPDLPPGVEEILADRVDVPALAPRFKAFAPEVAIDVILSSERQARALMDTLRRVARRVVAVSSIDVYRAVGVLHGTEPGPLEPLPISEDSPVRSQGAAYPPQAIEMLGRIFGWLDADYDKVPVERAIMSDPDLPGTVLRLPFVYGPGDPLHRMHPIVKRVDDGREAIIVDGQIANWRGPRGYVENVAAAIALAATDNRAQGRVYNVAEERIFTEREWTEEVARAAGFRGRIVITPAERTPPHLKLPGNFDQEWVVDASRIRRELGYIEPVTREDALRRSIEWERENRPLNHPLYRFDYAAEDAAL